MIGAERKDSREKRGDVLFLDRRDCMSNIWMRVMIAAYRGIPIIVESLDGMVEKTAMGAFYYAGNGTATYDNIIDTTDRKVRLLNFLTLADRATDALEDDLKMLVKKRIEGITFEKIAKEMEWSMRNIFRLYEIALTSMRKYLDINGYNGEWMDTYWGADNYLGQIYSRLKANEISAA